jgi:hypothetical protein
VTDGTRGRIAQWLWRPPRPHGETIAGRTVSFLAVLTWLWYSVSRFMNADEWGEERSARTDQD